MDAAIAGMARTDCAARLERLCATAAEANHTLPGVGHLILFNADRWQQVRAMPFRRPTLVRVLAGVKRLTCRDRVVDLGPGRYLAVPAGLTLDLGNRPDAHGAYRALVLQFAPELIRGLAQLYPELIEAVLQSAAATRRAGTVCPADAAPADAAPAEARLAGSASDELDRALLELAGAGPGTPRQRHAAHGALLALAEAGHGHLLLGRERSLADRVQDLVELQPGFGWSAAAIAGHLAISVPTLHRQLRASGQSLGAILQEVRLAYGLNQVLTTRRPIQDIALDCGYASPSRFAVRFRERFGAAPSELR